MMFIGTFFFIALAVILVILVVWLVKSSAFDKNRFLPHLSEEQDRSPIEILDERYARGEIDRVQYQQMRDDLQ